MVCDTETDETNMKHSPPPPIPALLEAHTRMEHGNAKRALTDLVDYLGVTRSNLLSWEEIPEWYRQPLSALCRVVEVHWERPEHDLFREVLADYRQRGVLDTKILDACIRDRRLPEDRRYLAANLVYALYAYAHAQRRPVRYQRWAVPPDTLPLLGAG